MRCKKCWILSTALSNPIHEIKSKEYKKYNSTTLCRFRCGLRDPEHPDHRGHLRSRRVTHVFTSTFKNRPIPPLLFYLRRTLAFLDYQTFYFHIGYSTFQHGKSCLGRIRSYNQLCLPVSNVVFENQSAQIIEVISDLDV